MFLLILGIVDILAAFAILLSGWFPETFVFYLSWVVLLKGIISIIGSIASGFWLDFLGAIDIIAALILFNWFGIPWFWVLPLLKGIYSVVMGLVMK